MPVTKLSVTPQAVVTATNVNGNTTVILEPADQRVGASHRDRRHLHGHDHPFRLLSAVPDRSPSPPPPDPDPDAEACEDDENGGREQGENADGLAGQGAGRGRGGPAPEAAAGAPGSRSRWAAQTIGVRLPARAAQATAASRDCRAAGRVTCACRLNVSFSPAARPAYQVTLPALATP